MFGRYAFLQFIVEGQDALFHRLTEIIQFILLFQHIRQFKVVRGDKD